MAQSEIEMHGSVGYIRLLAGNPGYRSLWMGEVVSLFGDWFNLIASASLIAGLTNSGLAVGGLFVVRMLSPFMVSPFAGVAADRYNRKKILIAADISRFFIVMGFLFVRSAHQVWMLYALTILQLGISGFFAPARNAILPDIVSRRELGAANALSSATWSVMLALGAALGGVVAGSWGIYPAFVIDAVTFAISAIFISTIRYQRDAALSDSGASLKAALDQYIDGLRYLFERRDILMIAMQKAAMALVVGGIFQIIQVDLAEKIFIIGEGGSTSLGIIYAVVGVGTGIGPIVARRFSGDEESALKSFLVWAYVLNVLGLAIIAPLSSFNTVLFGTLLRSIGSGINWVFTTQLLLLMLPDRVRGRVFSSEFALFTLANAASTAAGGWVLDSLQLTLGQIIWGIAALSVIPGVIWILWIARTRIRTASGNL